MNNALSASVAALMLSAIAVGIAMINSPDAPVSAEAARPVSEPPSSVALRAQLGDLIEANARLRARMAMLEAQPSSSRTAADSVTAQEFDAFREEVRAALEALAGGGPLAASIKDPEFKTQLADTLQEIRQDEAVAAVVKKYQARVDRLDERMLDLESKLGLTSQQSGRLRTAFMAQYERGADLERRWREGEDVAVLGEVKADDYQSHRDDLAGILTPQQLETYGAARQGGGK